MFFVLTNFDIDSRTAILFIFALVLLLLMIDKAIQAYTLHTNVICYASLRFFLKKGLSEYLIHMQ